MNGYASFKYYLSIKLHFTNKSFNVFETRYTKTSLESFLLRPDRNIFEHLAKKFDVSRDLIQYYVASCSNGHFNLLYDYDVADKHYANWKSYKQAKTYKFKTDLQIVVNYAETKGIEFNQALWKCYLNRSIHIQSIHICNEIDNCLQTNMETNSMLFEQDYLRIKKLQGFIKIEDNLKHLYETSKNIS